MARGLQEKIAYRIRKGTEEEGDRLKALTYLSRLKKAKENKGVKFYTKEVDYGKYIDFEIFALEDPTDEAVAAGKKFVKQ